MAKRQPKKEKLQQRSGRNGSTAIEDDRLYFVSDLVCILQVCRRTIVRYKQEKNLPLSGVARGSILGADLKAWLKSFSA